MGKVFAEVVEADFSKIGGERPSFLLIEDALVAIGGGGKAGVNYKYDVVKAAGWKYERLTSYGKDAALATQAFNRVREVLAVTSDADAIMEALKTRA